jgi:hypothetical protein
MVWMALNLRILGFADLGLTREAPDSVIWQVCQDREFVLITGNRNQRGADSLEATLRARNAANHLPVLTLSDRDQILRNSEYADRVVLRMLDYLIDIENLRGTGRLWLP